MNKVEVICGWCRKSFETENQRNPKIESYGFRICPHCGRTVQASRKELTGNVVGRKKWKSQSKTGDIV